MDENLQEMWNLPAGSGSQGIAVSGTGEIFARGGTRNVTLYRITGEVLGTYPAESGVRFISAVPGTGSFIIGTEQKMVLLNVTVPALSGEFRSGPASITRQTQQSAPVPVLPGIIAIGLCIHFQRVRRRGI